MTLVSDTSAQCFPNSQLRPLPPISFSPSSPPASQDPPFANQIPPPLLSVAARCASDNSIESKKLCSSPPASLIFTISTSFSPRGGTETLNTDVPPRYPLRARERERERRQVKHTGTVSSDSVSTHFLVNGESRRSSTGSFQTRDGGRRDRSTWLLCTRRGRRGWRGRRNRWKRWAEVTEVIVMNQGQQWWWLD